MEAFHELPGSTVGFKKTGFFKSLYQVALRMDKMFSALMLAVLFACSAQSQTLYEPLYEFPGNRSSRVSSFENLNGKKGSGAMTNKTAKGHAFEVIKPGETKTLLDINNPAYLAYRRSESFDVKKPAAATILGRREQARGGCALRGFLREQPRKAGRFSVSAILNSRRQVIQLLYPDALSEGRADSNHQ
jgi:hypothetical protein